MKPINPINPASLEWGSTAAELLLTLLITAISLVIKLTAFESFALLLALGSLYLHVLLGGILVRRRRRYPKWKAAVMVAPVTLLFFWYLRPTFAAKNMAEQAALNEGDLIPSRYYLKSNSTSTSTPVIEGGNGPVFFVWNGPSTFMFKTGPDGLGIRRQDGLVKFSIQVRDNTGATIVEIKDNHWLVSANTAVCWDKNHNDNSLEVLDKSRSVVLQVRIFADGVQLQADLNKGTDHEFLLDEHGMYDEDDGIVRLFSYSSETNLGLYSGKYLITPH